MAERIVQQPVATERQQKFSDLPTAEIQRSTFDMSHAWKGTCDVSRIIPIMLQEVLPGDSFRVSSTVFARLATPLKPIMDNLTTDIHYFFVPDRLLWDNFALFMGERRKKTDDPTKVTIPQARVDVNINNSSGQLPDYFGIPLLEAADNTPIIVEVNALPFRGYQMIWNEWYRNQNIIDALEIPTDDGPDDVKYQNVVDGDVGFLWFRHKRADYFTRALPWPQKGDPVFLPLGTRADILGIGKSDEIYNRNNVDVYERGGDATYIDAVEVGGDNSNIFIRGFNIDGTMRPSIRANLTEATAATINDIRTAFQIQKLLERDARGGTRYIEIILNHFNVQSPDYRLQRPEYLGGGSGKIAISPVAATIATDDAPQANLAAVGTGLIKAGFSHSFTEHGYIFALMSTRGDVTYQEGLDRMWSRKTRYDLYWPSLSHLGEQAILNKEIYLQAPGAGDPSEGTDNDSIWGYQERYAEYRYQPSRITGLFRSNHPESLDVWHLAQDFGGLPPLSSLFVTDGTPMDRVVAVPSEPDLLVDAWHEVKATRPMPIYAVPGLVDHF